ncbi:MAG: acyl-CoA dehydrogenase [Syntrophomonadaceae bacterium]|nr:acyl-CoA dehydrogenase [Syntrophomonadaceae bacterium]
MAERFANRRDIRFLLEEVFDVNSLTQYKYFKDHSVETFNMVVDTVMKMGSDLMYPVFQEMDKNPPRYEDSQAKVHPAVRIFLDECGRGGWLNADWNYAEGGQQLPNMIKFTYWFVFSAANYALGAYAQLTAGAANLIREFAGQEIKDQYLDKLCTGKWQGTMALTEPDVGSSLGDLTTSARETDQGYYLIKGKKIFISGADTDGADNTVNMMLARIQGAPAGTKGISLFVVPKYRINEAGELEYNDVHCDGIEHKLGYRGCPICQLTMGENNDCRGYLVGKPGRGLGYMFQMMNEERINVGIGAVAKATAAYYAALEYCSQRKQGRRPGVKDQSLPMVAIIEHPDIKRMLLLQKSIAEGSLSLALQVSKYIDLIKVLPDEEEREKYSLLVELLVPVVKTYPAEAGIMATSAAIQCLGGYGYCQDFPVEQYYRDIRIDPIHEGTTGIQGQDILGRKISLGNGKAMQYFVAELLAAIQSAHKFENLQAMAAQLLQSLNELRSVTAYLLDLSAQGKIEEFLADGVLYLEMFSLIAIGWQWLLQAVKANEILQAGSSLRENDKLFYHSKIYTCRYFFSYELNKIYGLVKRLSSTEAITVEMEAKFLQV